MLPLDLRQGVPHYAQKNVVGRENRAIELKLNHRLGSADRRNLTAKVIEETVVPIIAGGVRF